MVSDAAIEMVSRPGALPAWVLRDGEAEAEVVPGRGGLVSRFRVRGRKVLAEDDEAVQGGGRNVRGGIPILFPTAGKLAGDRYTAGGVTRELRQHGFARDLTWRVERREGDGPARLSMELVSTTETLRLFPWEFRLAFVVELSGPSLRILQSYENRAAAPMPLHAGFHPYFAVADREKGSARVELPTARAWDKAAGRDVLLENADLTAAEVSLGSPGPAGAAAANVARLRAPSLGMVEVEASPELGHWVVWTLGGRDFVCLEPWTAAGDALNTGEGLLFVPPGGRKEMALEIRVA
jgi:galactose mutarotase-like enzyme